MVNNTDKSDSDSKMEHDNTKSSDINSPKIESKLDDALRTIESHANEIASVLHNITNDEYGKFKAEINDNEWVIKQESGDVSWLRQTTEDTQRYIISTQDDPTPDEVVEAMQEYPEFVDIFNGWVEEINTTIDNAAEEMIGLDSVEEKMAVESLLTRRDELTADAWQIVHVIAETVQDITGNRYGTFTHTINNVEWKLKYEDSGKAKYLKIGKTYVLGKDDPHPSDLVTLIEGLDEFVEAVNTWIEQQEADIQFEIEISSIEGENHDNN